MTQQLQDESPGDKEKEMATDLDEALTDEGITQGLRKNFYPFGVPLGQYSGYPAVPQYDTKYEEMQKQGLAPYPGISPYVGQPQYLPYGGQRNMYASIFNPHHAAPVAALAYIIPQHALS